MNHILRCHDFIRDDMVRGDNCYLYDTSGRRYVGFESGIWCTALGHANPKINRKITEQIDVELDRLAENLDAALRSYLWE